MDNLLHLSHTCQLVLSFLTPEDLAHLAQVNKVAKRQVDKVFPKLPMIVVEEYVCWGNAVQGMTWAKQKKTKGQRPCFEIHHVSTKQNAMCLAEELEKKPLVFGVKIGYASCFHTGERKTTIGYWNYSDGRTKNFVVNGKWVFKWQR